MLEEERVTTGGGMVARSLIFAGFLGAGLLSFVIIWLGFYQRLEPYFWASVPATVLESQVASEDDALVPAARYRYAWQGKEYVSKVFRRPNQSYAHRDDVEPLIADLPAGAETTCRIDPSAPARAVLRTNGLEIGRFFVIPACFLWIGVCGLRRNFFPRRGDPSLMGPIDAFGTRLLFGGIFVVTGWTLLADVFLPAWNRARESMTWVATPCTKAESSPKRIAYRYIFAGGEHVGDRVDFWDGYSGEKTGRDEAVARLNGSRGSTCYVNPARPSEAVLLRSAGGVPWVFLVPLVFLGGGILTILGRVRRKVSAEKYSAGS